MLNTESFDVLLVDQFHGFEGSPCSSHTCPKHAMIGAVRTPFGNKLIKVSQAYSSIESGQFPMLDWICSFVHLLCCTWPCMLCLDNIASSNFLQSLRTIYLP